MYYYNSTMSRELPVRHEAPGGAAEQDADSPADGSKRVYSAVRGNRQELWERSMLDGRERLLLSTTGW